MIRIIGRTEEVNQCEHCGRNGLRHTVILDVDGEIVHFGTSCAANTYSALGTAADIKHKADRVCHCGCGQYATVITASGARWHSECRSSLVSA